MSSTEKFCLKWNDFKENVSSTFRTLRDDTDFANVTLACEDGQQVEAHKVILAASSPFFQNLLRRNKHSHPLIYMRGMKSEDLVAIVDFLYHGEVNVYQENLDSFLVIAEELELKGLTKEENKPQTENDLGESLPKYEKNENRIRQTPSYYSDFHILPSDKNNLSHIEGNDSNPIIDRTVAIPKEMLLGDFNDLDAQVKSMWTVIRRNDQRFYSCNVCGKEGTFPTQMRDHIEANHIEGISLPCNFCEKTFRSRNSLRNHKSRAHK